MKTDYLILLALYLFIIIKTVHMNALKNLLNPLEEDNEKEDFNFCMWDGAFFGINWMLIKKR